MKRSVLAVTLAAALAAPALAQAQTGPWQVRARLVHLSMENKAEPGQGAAAGVLPGNAIEANDRWIPEVDVTYFFTKNLAAELVLTIPQKQTVKITSGALAETLGTFKHLPPTLLLQWHFMPGAAIQPYVGAGINYTRISSVNLRSSLVGPLQLENKSIGGALQVGVDIPMSKNMVFNVDLKKVYIDTDVKLNGAKISNLALDPVLLGVGIGWRF